MNVVRFLPGNFPGSEFCMPTFRNTLFHLHRRVGTNLPTYEDGTDSVPKRLYVKFRGRGITQKKEYRLNILFTIYVKKFKIQVKLFVLNVCG